MPKTTTTIDTKTSKAPPKPPSICFRLSEKHFLDIGWTVEKSYKPVKSVVTMKAKFLHPVISPWFKKRSGITEAFYAGTNRTLYVARVNGTGTIYYPDGRVAIDIIEEGIDNCRTRVWVYSPQEVDKDGLSRPHQLTALFDSLGNGVVYDYCMRRRLVYNQSEGVWLDPPFGVPVYWKWHDMVYSGSMSTSNDEGNAFDPLSSNHKSWAFPASEEVKTKDASPSVTKNPSKGNFTNSFFEAFDRKYYVDTAKVFPKSVGPLKPIFVQLNRYISLRVFSQSEVVLSFFANPHHLTHLKIGVLYNPFNKLKVSTIDDSAWFPKVVCNFEDLPAQTRSMLAFQKTVKKIRKRAMCSISLRK